MLLLTCFERYAGMLFSLVLPQSLLSTSCAWLYVILYDLWSSHNLYTSYELLLAAVAAAAAALTDKTKL